MRVVAVPGRLFLATSLLIWAVPLVAIETVLERHAPWWKLPWRPMLGAAGFISGVVALLGGTVLAGKRWSLPAIAALASLWCGLSLVLSIARLAPSIGFFTVGVLVYCSVTWIWIRHEMGRAFFDPRIRWYQRNPKPMPGLRGRLIEPALEVRVSRLDLDGAFLFRDGPFPVQKAGRVELLFSYRERQVRCQGRAISRTPSGTGVGFQFLEMSPDARKELGDFVEILRGEGHV